MPALVTLLPATARALRARLAERPRERDAGYTTETLVVTAVLVTIAVSALGILMTKVVAKANGIDLG